MEIRVVKVIRRGAKNSRLLLSSGEQVVVDSEHLLSPGDLYSISSIEEGTALRPLKPDDPFPSILRF